MDSNNFKKDIVTHYPDSISINLSKSYNYHEEVVSVENLSSFPIRAEGKVYYNGELFDIENLVSSKITPEDTQDLCKNADQEILIQPHGIVTFNFEVSIDDSNHDPSYFNDMKGVVSVDYTATEMDIEECDTGGDSGTIIGSNPPPRAGNDDNLASTGIDILGILLIALFMLSAVVIKRKFSNFYNKKFVSSEFFHDVKNTKNI